MRLRGSESLSICRNVQDHLDGVKAVKERNDQKDDENNDEEDDENGTEEAAKRFHEIMFK